MKNILCFFLFTILFFNTKAQDIERQVIANASHYMENGSLSLDATLGELIVTSLENTGISLSQGFHQGSLMITNTYEPFAHLDFQVFPNPTVASVQITSSSEEDLRAEVFDLTGRVLLRKTLAYPIDQSTLALDQLPAAHYFLKIMDRTGTPIFITSIQKIN